MAITPVKKAPRIAYQKIRCNHIRWVPHSVQLICPVFLLRVVCWAVLYQNRCAKFAGSHGGARCRAAHIIPSGLLHLSSAGLSDFGCTLSEKMTVPAGGNKWEWFKRYGRTKYPNSPPHTSTSVYCLRIWLNRAFTAAGASGWLLFTKPIT